MFTSKVIVILLFAVIASSHGVGKQWAFLVAGSKDWINYRHQADLCHAYQVLKKAGVPEENIITMFVDDVANSPQNSKRGVLINHPNGANVYEGVRKDYTGKDVSVKNLLAVLSGDEKAMKGIGSGRVIKSGPEDTIFVNIIDHGTPGSITINDDLLYADQFNDVLKKMNQQNSYKKMVIYVEACESGSMFDSIIDDNNNVFVMTAAAPDESSYVRYYDDDLQTYIGDTFSTIWMEHVEELLEKGSEEISLFKMYKYVRSLVTNSHVMLYGDFKLGFDKLETYVGTGITQTSNSLYMNLEVPSISNTGYHPKKLEGEGVSSRDVQMHILKKKLQSANNEQEKAKLTKKIQNIEQGREDIDSAIDDALQDMAGDDTKLYVDMMHTKNRATASIFPCYRAVITLFNKLCVDTNKHPYATKHFDKFINVCTHNIKLSKVRTAFKSACESDLKTSLKTTIV